MPFVQGVTASGLASPVTTPAFTAATTTGNLIVVAVSNDSGGTVTTTGVTDNKGNAYTKVLGTSSSSALDIYYAANISGGTGHTVAVNWSLAAASNLSVVAQEFSGMSATPLDVFVSALGSDAAPSSGPTAVTTQANELVVGIVSFDATATTVALGSGYSNLNYVNAESASTGMESKMVTSTGAQAATFTLGEARLWIAATVTFKTASANAGPVNPGAFLAFF